MFCKTFSIMPNYYLNKKHNPSGEHEVHKEACSFLPKKGNRMYLGSFENCRLALEESRKHYPNIDGCYFCCRECNKELV